VNLLRFAGGEVFVKFLYEILRAQVSVSMQHLHRFVPADGRNFLVASKTR